MRRAVLAFVLLVASCAGQRPTLEDESAAREVGGSAPSTVTVVPDDNTGATLRLAVVGEWAGDPASAGPASLTERVLADLLFEGLTRLDDEGRPVAALAQRWFVSDDRLTWTFVLPDGLVDGEGERVTARDVKRSLEAVARRGPVDQAATALLPIVGWRDHMVGASGGVAGIAAPDEATLVIRLSTPFELLPAVLAAPAFGVSGDSADGSVRTTGAYRYGDEDDVLVAVDPEATVDRIELVRTDTDPTPLVRDGVVDWAVLAPDAVVAVLPADVIRQPLELELVLVVRLREPAQRLGTVAALEPVLLATEVDALSPRPVVRAEDPGVTPAGIVVDIPSGPLEPVGAAVVAQLEASGVEVLAVTTEPSEFAARVAAGDALVFPALMAGGTGGPGGLLRLAAPGGVDDVFGPADEARGELAAAVEAATDPVERDLFAEALERTLIDQGFLLPIGVFEVRVAVADAVDGLRHRPDGTLDLSGVTIER